MSFWFLVACFFSIGTSTESPKIFIALYAVHSISQSHTITMKCFSSYLFVIFSISISRVLFLITTITKYVAVEAVKCERGDITLANIICKSLWKTKIELQSKTCTDCWLGKGKKKTSTRLESMVLEIGIWINKGRLWWFTSLFLFVLKILRFFKRSPLNLQVSILAEILSFLLPLNRYSLDCFKKFLQGHFKFE